MRVKIFGSSGVTRVNVIRGVNWRCHPIFPEKRGGSLSDVTDLRISCLLLLPLLILLLPKRVV